MKNRIEDLRNHLFATIEALQDEDNPMEVGRAKAISDVAQTIINSAKVEIDFIRATEREPESGFFEGRVIPPLSPVRKIGRKY